MVLSHLEVTDFRNIDHISIDLDNHLNIFIGENGSGKTSLLEAIYHLSFGRSFRTRNPGKVIQFGKDKFSLFAEIASIPVGVERYFDGKMRLRKAREDVKSISELTDIFPVQLINPDIYQLINSGAEERRKFINWGMFHVKPRSFLKNWQQMRRILQQRNAALKQFRPSKEEIILWGEKLAEVSAPIRQEQQNYVDRFKQKVAEILPSLLDIKYLDFIYYSGWDDTKLLQEVLRENVIEDLQRGYTQFGLHRADLQILVENRLVKDVLSRGQQKLLACAMLLAQASLLEEETGKKCALLVDDLASELDEDKRKRISAEITKLNVQTFITGTESGPITKNFDQNLLKSFQLDQGKIC
ncbi:MAG: DNA replication/repair protein RecF [Gammaproteobacteria bacterium]|jgi:DNA replication and repair protein RecF